MDRDHIGVVVRFRPRTRAEGAACTTIDDDKRSVRVENTAYTFDAVLPPESTQADAFDCVVDIVDAVMQGFNGTLLAYGQTGSGKTHSMIGDVDDEAQCGLLPRAVRRVFEAIVADESAAEFAVTCSYVEIYKEVVRDLLQPSPSSSACMSASMHRALTVIASSARSASNSPSNASEGSATGRAVSGCEAALPCRSTKRPPPISSRCCP